MQLLLFNLSLLPGGDSPSSGVPLHTSTTELDDINLDVVPVTDPTENIHTELGGGELLHQGQASRSPTLAFQSPTSPDVEPELTGNLLVAPSSKTEEHSSSEVNQAAPEDPHTHTPEAPRPPPATQGGPDDAPTVETNERQSDSHVTKDLDLKGVGPEDHVLEGVGPEDHVLGLEKVGLEDQGLGLEGVGPEDQGLGLEGDGPEDQGPGLDGVGPEDQGPGLDGIGPEGQGPGLEGVGPEDQGPGLELLTATDEVSCGCADKISAGTTESAGVHPIFSTSSTTSAPPSPSSSLDQDSVALDSEVSSVSASGESGITAADRTLEV